MLKTLFALLLLSVSTALAQSVTTVHAFPLNPAGEILPPMVLFKGNDGSLYGSVVTAPPPGAALLKLNSDGTVTTVSVTGITGCGVSLQASDGNFYGKTVKSLCQITPGGSATALSAFAQSLGDNLISPTSISWPTLGGDGAFYGLVYGSAISSTGPAGIAYRLTLSGSFAVSVFPQTDEPLPTASQILGRDGNIYGIAPPNSTDQGFVFKLTPSGTLTFLHRFQGPDGMFPIGLTSAIDGALYGITGGGGTSNAGTFFRIDSGGVFSVLYNFQNPPRSAVNGNSPVFVQAADGYFYGATSNGSGAGDSIYQLSSLGAYKVVATLDPDTSVLCLITGVDGNVYGSSETMHPSQATPIIGSIFKLAPGSSAGGMPSGSQVSVTAAISASAFGGFSSVSPGSWIEIYGANLAKNTRSWAGTDFSGNNAPTSLDGVSVTVGGKSAFLSYISPGQVNALIPSDTPTGVQPIIVTSPAGMSSAFSINTIPVQPGLLAPANFKIGNVQYAAAIFPDGTYALPVGAVPGLASRPAKPGDVVTLYGIGFGSVMPVNLAGQLVQQANSLAMPLLMSVGGVPAAVSYDGLAPNYTGLYQFNITIPAAATGDALLTFTLGGTAGTQAFSLPITN